MVVIFYHSISLSRYLHVYLRQLINHIHLILLIATYNLNWPESLQEFFDFTRPLVQTFSELVKLDCLFTGDNYDSREGDIRLFYIKLIFLGALPLLFGLSTFIFWKLHNYRLSK